MARLIAWMLCGAPLAALAQSEAEPGAPAVPEAAPALRASPLLQEKIPEAVRPQLPIFVKGDSVTGQPDINAIVEGNAELRRGDTIIHADRLEYVVPDDLAKARGQVRINRAGNVYEGSEAGLQWTPSPGYFDAANYRFLMNGAHGEASRVDFIDRDRSVVHNATYTTCQKNDEATWQPDWVLRARSIRIDNEEQVGTADGAVLEFKGLPILPIPHITFPLSDRRKSGLLPPTVAIDNVSGVEYAQPYYWNIAPNRDATITPTVMSKRGVNLGGEFRYLEPTYRGEPARRLHAGRQAARPRPLGLRPQAQRHVRHAAGRAEPQHGREPGQRRQLLARLHAQRDRPHPGSRSGCCPATPRCPGAGTTCR